MKKFQHFFNVACFLFTAVAVTSCDNEYDLSKDINGEISVGKNFTLPVGETVKIPLSRIIEEGEDLTADAQSGIYQLNASGEFTSHIAETTMPNIDGLNPNLEPQTITFWEENQFNQAREALDKIFQIKEEYEKLFPGTDFTQFVPNEYKEYLKYLEPQKFGIELHTKATYEMEKTQTELPKEVKSLYKVVFNGDKGTRGLITIRLDKDKFNGVDGIQEIHFHELDINFPEVFVLTDKDNELSDPNNKHETLHHDVKLSAENNYTAEIEIYIKSIDIDDEAQKKYIFEENGKTYFRLQENEHITFSVESADAIITATELTDNQIYFDFDFQIDATNITNVNGKVSPDVNINEELTLNDLPDFIKDESSQFTPNDLAFSISLDNPLGLELATTISITPYNNYGHPTGAPVNIVLEGNNIIKASTTTKYVISNNPDKKVDNDVTFIHCPELPNLLSPIPDYYKITSNELIADGKNSNGLELGKNYDLTGKYDVEVPFSFSSLTINYSDEVDGLRDDLEDFADLTDKIELSFDIESTIPVDLTATVKLLDEHGHELKDIVVTGTKQNTVEIKAGADDNPTTTHITLTIEEKEGSTQLEDLERIKYNVKATNPIGKDVVLKSSQYVIIKNGVAKIPNGITTEL